MNKNKVLLCVTGSIAAYKSADIASKLISNGYDVYVVMTHSATKFISPMIFETLTVTDALEWQEIDGIFCVF